MPEGRSQEGRGRGGKAQGGREREKKAWGKVEEGERQRDREREETQQQLREARALRHPYIERGSWRHVERQEREIHRDIGEFVSGRWRGRPLSLERGKQGEEKDVLSVQEKDIAGLPRDVSMSEIERRYRLSQLKKKKARRRQIRQDS